MGVGGPTKYIINMQIIFRDKQKILDIIYIYVLNMSVFFTLFVNNIYCEVQSHNNIIHSYNMYFNACTVQART